jgi:RND family efflux transporter MFP subunit
MSDNQNTDLSFLKINRDEPPRNGGSAKGKFFLYGGIGVVLIIVIGFIFSATSHSTEQVELGTVAMTTPAQESSVLTASGYVVAQRKAAVASKGTGRLVYLGVIEGDRVKKGEIIGRLESNDVEAVLGQAKASLNVAKAGLETAQAELDDAKNNFDREKTLFSQGSISKAEYDIANARYKKALAGIASAEANIQYGEANVRSAEVGVENTLIRAPFNGVVLTKDANVGEVISPFGAAAGSRGAIVTVADMTSLEVEADVSESNIEKIKEHQPCEISLDAYPDVRYQGYVNKIVPTADRAKATVLTKVRFNTLDEKVLPEMRAKVNFLNDRKSPAPGNSVPILSIPASALTTRNGQNVVFVVDGETVTETAVSTGDTMGNRIEVKKGVSAGQKIVLHPSEHLSTGSTISTEK